MKAVPARARLRRMTFRALFAAVICLVAPFAIPVGAVPVTLGLLAVLLTAMTLRPLDSLLAVALYLALGACGLPVFSGGGGGFAVLTGVTGGYLWSYLPVSLLVSLAAHSGWRRAKNPRRGILFDTFICLAGVMLCYLCGTVQFCLVSGTSPLPALSLCIFPFIPFDFAKSLGAAFLGARLAPLAEKEMRL